MNAILKSPSKARTSILTFALLVVTAAALNPVKFRGDEPGLGRGMSGLHQSFVAGQPVRDNRRPMLEVLRDLSAGETGNGPIVWIGNSHLHTINGRESGDRLSSTLLHVAMNGEAFPGERPVLGISLPNLRYEEQFLLTVALAQLPDARRPSVIVHGTRFRDARRSGVRERVRPLLRMPEMKAWLATTDWARDAPEAASAMRRSLSTSTDEETADVGLEAWLVGQIGPYLPIFQRRAFIEWKATYWSFLLRNWVFRVDEDTRRRMVPSRYRAGTQFLEAALRVAHESNIRVLIYNCPLRKEVRIPYFDDEYSRFRDDLAAIAQRQNASFQDYDALIPKEAWGIERNSGSPDFSHFSGEGHVILAERVRQDILQLLEPERGLETSRLEGATRSAL